MDMQTLWADRGNTIEFAGGKAETSGLIVASRGAVVAMTAPTASFWIVLRGAAEVESRDGRFALTSGQWLSLERDARPTVYASRDAVVVALALSANLQARLLQSARVALYPGRGRLPPRSARLFFSLWRRSGVYQRNAVRACVPEQVQLNQLLRFTAGLQAGWRGLIEQCPGRSLHRKRQVFVRMQRARLFLEGNLARPVRIAELAALSNVSIWYFTKTFHALYGEGPQACAARLRLEQAAQLLRGTRLCVSEIGAACGFENNCSFSRAFRAHYGMPPSLYRVGDALRQHGQIHETA
jgi:AraC family transcriptional regulator